jgi:prepilin-type N-terminal cleavage/methylation domain-containing protein
MNKGFSLIEVLVVLIILGTLASLAIPVFTGQTEQAYKAEAFNALGVIRRAQLRYFSANNTFTRDLRFLGLSVSPGGISLIVNDQIRTTNFQYEFVDRSRCMAASGISAEASNIKVAMDETGKIFDPGIDCNGN